MPIYVRLFFALLVGAVQREQQEVILYLQAENVTLRELLGEGRRRYTPRQRRRLAEAGKRLGRGLLARYATLVTLDTILRWFRQLVAAKYSSASTTRGRPRRRQAIAALVVKVASENPGFGYTRIRDVLHNLGVETSRSTVKRILDEQGVVPAPERSRVTTWGDFLSAHWDGLVAGDFFQIEVLTWSGIVRYSVLFVMELRTRRVHVAGIARDPDGGWVLARMRALLDDFDGFLRGKTHLILDRDPLFTAAAKQLLAHGGVEVVTLPRRSPNLNAYAERFVRSIKHECLDRLVILGEGHLRHAVREYLEHYHRERNHQGLHSVLIDPGPEVGRQEGSLRCRTRLGGLLRYYHREVA